MRSCLIALALGLGLGAKAMGREEYPRAELLVEPAELAKPKTAKDFLVLDARDKAKYEAGHIPGARWVNHADWANAFGEGTNADAWSKRIGNLGISADSRVVIYDEDYTKNASRIWWILRYWGVNDVRLLNGGWVGWKQGDFPVQKEAAEFASSDFKARSAPERLATKEALLKALKDGSFQILDTRSHGEHCGTDALKNRRAGAIPGAKHLEWIDLLNTETHRFKSAAELKKLFDAAGIQLDRPTATHCQSGGRAAVMAFGLELMGAKQVRNYYKSWSEWGNSEDTPIVQPKAKK
jgi:thiosulfate/3-mercaptopyruvate sulfurtransferase